MSGAVRVKAFSIGRGFQPDGRCIAGERLLTNTWVLLAYPMVRYGIYAGIAI
jgi:hypothetical protein